MRPLDRKLLRDLARLWAQALAVALVLACGVMTIIIAVGAFRSLEETRAAYYDRYRFANLFADAVRAPKTLAGQIATLPGVAAYELRITTAALLDIPGMPEPATGLAISLPDHREPAVNRLFIRSGRLPATGRTDEVAVNASFAEAHGFTVGSRFSAILNGRKKRLTIVGTVLSPEYVYALGPGDLVPDPRRFAIIYMSETVLAALLDREGAFNNVVLRLWRDGNVAAVAERLDALLAPYGGTGAYARKDQMSHAFLDSELTQLQAMSRVIPPVFLFVSAFLINMILSRLIALEREQIGLLKALGYSNAAVASHYGKLVIAIALVGVAIGSAAGTWLGQGMTRLYGEFFSFPFLIFRQSLDLYAIAGGISVAAALAGALKAIWSAVSLAPAVAMQPPAPPRYRRLFGDGLGLMRMFSQLTVMAFRHLVRRPVRAALTALGTSLAVALLVTALFSFDSIAFMIDAIYYRADRQDATLSFSEARPPGVVQAVGHLPGVLAVEPFRSVPVVIRNGSRERRLAITGKPAGTRLSRILDLDLRPVVLPEAGLALSERVATVLAARPGDVVEVEVLEGRRGAHALRVSAVIQSYIGLAVFMHIDALDRLVGDGPRISGAHVGLDAARLGALYDAVKSTPALGSITLQTVSRQKFRDTIEQNIGIMTTLYVVLAVIIAFGVVYNSARIQLSERARELASLRVLGFTRAEVSRVLLVELSVIVLAAQPLGWLAGFGFAWVVTQGFESDLFRIPFVVEPDTFAMASLVVLLAALGSALIVRRRVNRLDLIRVLKTRE